MRASQDVSSVPLIPQVMLPTSRFRLLALVLLLMFLLVMFLLPLTLYFHYAHLGSFFYWMAGTSGDICPFLREDMPLMQRSISWCAVARSCSC